jgi:hypothetical protein
MAHKREPATKEQSKPFERLSMNREWERDDGDVFDSSN